MVVAVAAGALLATTEDTNAVPRTPKRYKMPSTKQGITSNRSAMVR
jgi:hypothetical protein